MISPFLLHTYTPTPTHTHIYIYLVALLWGSIHDPIRSDRIVVDFQDLGKSFVLGKRVFYFFCCFRKSRCWSFRVLEFPPLVFLDIFFFWRGMRMEMMGTFCIDLM